MLYQDGGRAYATVNRAALAGEARFGEAQPVSPRLLSASEKRSRWQSVWFPDVVLDIGGA
ncbi:hypothetical protein [Propionivibrio sp.]|uniref:hypothetical protein n=1 Tax=Propionivibrio sp. TaxID=2212460 RepID=UPI0039E21A93